MHNYLLHYHRVKLRKPLIERTTDTEPARNVGEHQVPSEKITRKEEEPSDPTKEFSMPGNPNFEAAKQGMQRELEKIVRGEDLPISKETRRVLEGEIEGFPIRRTCSDRKIGDSASVDFDRWNQKMNRYFSLT